MKEIYESMQKLLKSKEKIAPEMNKNYKKLDERWKQHILFVVSYILLFEFFFESVFTIRVAMVSVKFRIVPKASVFRDDAYFEGPGAQKDHFWRNLLFGKICFKRIPEKYFPGHFFLKKRPKFFLEKWGWGQLWFWGRARKITPLVYPLVFENFFGHENSRRGSFWSNYKKKVSKSTMLMPLLRSNWS